ncbi:hypothetical protein PV797_10885 [Clostridiaceae bacterium M8S5]|nr:hypothetical protein PV797_10885 [Clostridiaceae bacterium M8S5]
MKCKIENTHRRLLESHRLWHQTLDNYFDPEAFRVNLNATIQALRNLTFALQNEKSEFEDFDNWYNNWQNKMKQDTILKWLNSARVEIVHKQDLEKKSIARVTILGYEEILKVDIEFPIEIPEYMIAIYLREKDYITDEIILMDYALKIERRWVVNDLSDYEILDALAYCYGFMYRLVKDAHSLLGLNIESCSIRDTLHSRVQTNYCALGIPDCMMMSNNFRTKQLSLKSLETKKIVEHEVYLEEETVKKAVKRYKIKKDNIKLPSTHDDLKKFGRSLLEMAKNVLAKDGYHRPILFLLSKDNEMILHQLAIPEDKSDKFIIMQEIANKVKKVEAEGIVLLVESWITSDIEAYIKGIPTELHTEKKECLITYIATKKDVNTSFMSIFSRNKLGKIKFEDIIENELDCTGILSPIYKVWNKF